MTMPLAIVEAMERGAFVPLPDRSGFFVMLDTTNGLACPDCERAMAFVIVRQCHHHLRPSRDHLRPRRNLRPSPGDGGRGGGDGGRGGGDGG